MSQILDIFIYRKNIAICQPIEIPFKQKNLVFKKTRQIDKKIAQTISCFFNTFVKQIKELAHTFHIQSFLDKNLDFLDHKI